MIQISVLCFILFFSTALFSSSQHFIIKLKAPSFSAQTLTKTYPSSNSSKFSSYKLKKVTPIKKVSSSISVQQQGTTLFENIYTFQTNDSIERIKEHFTGDAAYIEEVYPITLASTSEDPLYTQQSYFEVGNLKRSLQWQAHHPVTVAVIDSGIDYNHPELETRILKNNAELVNELDDDQNGVIDDVYGINFYSVNQSISGNSADPIGHGTHIAGIIAAQTNNGEGIKGINQNVKIMNLRFLNDRGNGTQLDAALAIVHAVDNGAKIINCSWGYYRYNTILKNAINYANKHGVIIVAAAGNDGWNRPHYPAGFDSVIAVGSITNDYMQSYFTNWGNHIDFVAPGHNIVSTAPQSSYNTLSGTSQSAAIITGIISLLIGQDPTLKKEAILDMLQRSATDLFDTGKDPYSGYGVLSLNKLINASSTNTQQLPQQAGSLSVSNMIHFPNPIRTVHNQSTFRFQCNSNTATARVRLFDLRGREVLTLADTCQNGETDIRFDHSLIEQNNLSNGTYLYVTIINDGSTEKMLKGKLSIIK